MSNDDLDINPKQGWLKVKLHSHSKWHRRYCIIDWDKAILFIASKIDRRYREWIKLLPNILMNDCESSSDNTIEIKSDNEIHLLQTESKDEYDCWFLALKRTAYSRIGGGIFGQSLENTFKYSHDKSSSVPFIVRQCCEFLLEYGSTFVGLFRIPGKQSSIKELRDMYDRGVAIELNNSYSPATISSLLKLYLHSLPEPIIPVKNFDEYFEFGSRFKYNQTNDIDRLKQLIERTLSGINYALLAYLCLFLKKLTHYAHETKMDTDNLAVTFGNNLIRACLERKSIYVGLLMTRLYARITDYDDRTKDLDYLVKEIYLFLSFNSNQGCEPNNESIAKSSGFSSFSSLLSNNEQPIKINSRSSSMPSIRFTTFSSVDSSNLSSDDHLDTYTDTQYCSEFTIDKSINDNEQSFVTCCEREEENIAKQVYIRPKRFSCAGAINDEERTKNQIMIIEKKHRSGKNLVLYSHILINNQNLLSKTTKKSFANKFGKSLSSFKTSMNRAFNPQFTSTDNLQYTSTMNISSCPSNPLPDYFKTLHDEIRVLKQIIDRKEMLLNHVTKTFKEDRLKYERENLQLKQRIDQLQDENMQLKTLHQSDI
uniref:Rho GTPase activating protein n=1 Tax=Adineta vaga TaxID=104782 RepID=B5AH87_ADIVA|nr:rho GTPase activating protein [Adineta vaga]